MFTLAPPPARGDAQSHNKADLMLIQPDVSGGQNVQTTSHNVAVSFAGMMASRLTSSGLNSGMFSSMPQRTAQVKKAISVHINATSSTQATPSDKAVRRTIKAGLLHNIQVHWPAAYLDLSTSSK